MNFEYHMPTRVIFGSGVLDRLGEIVGESDAGKALIVTGSGSMRKTGVLERVISLLGDVSVEVFDNVESDPSVDTIDDAVEYAREVDLIVGLGGGSPLDAAKAISAVVGNGGNAGDYLKGRGIKNPGPGMVAIPTTSGTGTEVTQISVLSDRKTMIKKSIRSPLIYPRVALDDPTLTRTMPREVTAYTGMDALTHAIEAYSSLKSQPMTDILCMEAVRIVLDNIENAYVDGGDMVTRERMMYASLIAGFGITHASAGLAHGLSYAVWRVAGVPHGVAVGLLLPHVMMFNMKAVGGKFDALAEYCGLCDAGELVSRIVEVKESIGIPARLGGIGVGVDDVDSMVELGLGGSTKANPRMVDGDLLAAFIGGII
ncbi:MAG: iron-containing alcohol dehydrogenase [Candidatus Altiarchaeota archaeon]